MSPRHLKGGGFGGEIAQNRGNCGKAEAGKWEGNWEMWGHYGSSGEIWEIGNIVGHCELLVYR